ncbi:MAG: aminodeoxychorismate synthase, component I [Fimbriimonadales bacterium]|nr:MAG: aminodeoxychorismate synthase, component I [Fimbriimonadales bacterium]
MSIVALSEGTRWLAAERPVAVIDAFKHSEILPALAEVERAAQRGRTAVGFVAYEAAHGLDKAFPQAQAGLPLVWFGLYDHVVIASSASLLHMGLGRLKSSLPPSLAWQTTLNEPAYHRALQRIRDYIAAGDVYQVNYTFRLRAPFEGDPQTLFMQLYHAQPVPYAAYLDMGDCALLSLSPELFFQLEGGRIVSRPMKGTAPRGRTVAEDLQQAQSLPSSEKNRAENLMIVDMVRNDLGRIARTGTVSVPRIFEVERYATLWQMTSTVEAETDAPLPEIFRALSPAASITGAPKIRAAQIIHELETTPRGVYTGAIGVVLPNRRAQFNVAIRTFYYDYTRKRLEYGVGSGIVWDSDQRAEYEECLAKAQVILKPRTEFELLETILWRPRRGYFLLEKHLQRLQRSAEYFGYKWDGAMVQDLLRNAPFPDGGDAVLPACAYRVRLLLNCDGKAQVECAPLEPKPRNWRVALAPEPVDTRDMFLYHKTTNRTIYERARASCPDCDDVILWNALGEITESTIANVVVRLHGKLYTPPVSCGLLGGVYREYLLERGWIEERVITIDELRQAEAIYLINSLRGRVRAQLR